MLGKAYLYSTPPFGCFWNSSSVDLVDDGPFSFLYGRLWSASSVYTSSPGDSWCDVHQVPQRLQHLRTILLDMVVTSDWNSHFVPLKRVTWSAKWEVHWNCPNSKWLEPLVLLQAGRKNNRIRKEYRRDNLFTWSKWNFILRDFVFRRFHGGCTVLWRLMNSNLYTYSTAVLWTVDFCFQIALASRSFCPWTTTSWPSILKQSPPAAQSSECLDRWKPALCFLMQGHFKAFCVAVEWFHCLWMLSWQCQCVWSGHKYFCSWISRWFANFKSSCVRYFHQFLIRCRDRIQGDFSFVVQYLILYSEYTERQSLWTGSSATHWTFKGTSHTPQLHSQPFWSLHQPIPEDRMCRRVFLSDLTIWF